MATFFNIALDGAMILILIGILLKIATWFLCKLDKTSEKCFIIADLLISFGMFFGFFCATALIILEKNIL